MADLTVNIAGVEFKNPVITASGTFGFGREYSEFYPLREIGGLYRAGPALAQGAGNGCNRQYCREHAGGIRSNGGKAL